MSLWVFIPGVAVAGAEIVDLAEVDGKSPLTVGGNASGSTVGIALCAAYQVMCDCHKAAVFANIIIDGIFARGMVLEHGPLLEIPRRGLGEGDKLPVLQRTQLADILSGGQTIHKRNSVCQMAAVLALCGAHIIVGEEIVRPILWRDDFDFLVIKEVLKTDKPILAICRGIQLLNVALGRTLIQDIPTQAPSSVLHKQAESRYEFSHYVNVVKGSPLAKIVGGKRLRVNSFHHQAIASLGAGLSVMATSEDGIIEAVYGESERFLRAYQWHPELLIEKDEISNKLFAEFVDACLKKSKNS